LIRLIGIDVDGTLVGSSGVVHPTVWATAEKARHQGIHLVLCSGRPAFGVALDYARRLDPIGWHVFQNGASIIDLQSRKSSSVQIAPDFINGLIKRARQTGDILELYSDSTYVTESTRDWARIHAEMLGVPFKPAPYESLGAPVVRAQWVLAESDKQRYMQAPPTEVQCHQSAPDIVADHAGFEHRTKPDGLAQPRQAGAAHHGGDGPVGDGLALFEQ